MAKATKRPKFSSEQDERVYWEKHDSSAEIDWASAKIVRLPNLKPSTTTISIRLPDLLLNEIKIEANRRDVPYQSLIKLWLAEKVASWLR